jgi:hypothetical protein
MNVEKLRKLQEFIQINPARFSMKEGIAHRGGWSESSFVEVFELLEIPACNTAACLAGETYIMEQGLPNCGVVWGTVQTEAMRILGLTSAEADRLFYLPNNFGYYCWPHDFAKRYGAAQTPQERVQVAVDRIELFIATNGAE